MTQSVEDAVRRTLAEYCQTVDDGRFEEFAALWAPEAVVRLPGQEVRGREAIRAWIEAAQPPERRGRHLTLNTVLDDVGAAEVTAVSDFVFLGRGERWEVRVVGRYHDELVPLGGRWVFRARTIEMPGVAGTSGSGLHAPEA
jgi:uncharacterized protein (TIGR02246 family)